MPVAEEFTFFPEPRPAVMVVSHERSGTHFLMNSLAACYGYVSRPWINFDHPTQSVLDIYSQAQICDFLLGMANRPMANIVKSHHTPEFFRGELERLTQRYVILVIYRNPVDVMLSWWRFMHHFKPEDNYGPMLPDPMSYASAIPSGLMLRYQTQPIASILQRWADHIHGWLSAASEYSKIGIVRYEDLRDRYEETMLSFATLLGRPPQTLNRPSPHFNIIRSGPADPMNTGMPPDVEALRSLCREKVGVTMARLGY
jgi:hypothetical protein